MRLKVMRLIGDILIFVALGLTLIRGIDFTSPPSQLKEYFSLQGVKQTGAINLVSSIYLSYRAFDTLGETIVLLLVVSGIILILGVKRWKNQK